ncbi:Lipocalin-like domain-containing protein [Chryseobacterium ureilyticum]|uniref:Lipocalin-like domain-containing protein n=2 Tax=Chryseobacterium TaxID=59732 RepID=A0A1N7KRS9_9FLAO|nr:lipocalin family protein [Chryseobacterium ureilyticum]SIS64322.1 Lipocalin-like domain-containing protein [Chryseobacterium ureilyticum]
MMRIVLSSVLVLMCASFGSAQKLKKEDVVGFWKLKESGFYEGKKKEKKDFDNCLLMRNYTIREDGFAIYNRIEGSVGNCIPTEPSLSFWKIVDNRIQFYINKDTIIDEVEVTLNSDKTITFTSYIPQPIKDKDPNLEKMLNTIYYDVLEAY